MTNQNNNQGDRKSKCCNAPKHTHYMASLSMEGDLCSQCGKKFIDNPCAAGDQVADSNKMNNKALQELIEKFMLDYVMGSIQVDEYTYWAHAPSPQEVKDVIQEAFKAGAKAAIEATKKIDYVYERGLICPKCREVYPEGSFKNFNIFCKRGCGEPVMSPIVYAEHQLQEFSDAFLNSLNPHQQRNDITN